MMCLTESEKERLLDKVEKTHDAVIAMVPTVEDMKPKVEGLMSFKNATMGIVAFVLAGSSIYGFIELIKWMKPKFM